MKPETVFLLVLAAVGLTFLTFGLYLERRGYGSTHSGDDRGPEGWQ